MLASHGNKDKESPSTVKNDQQYKKSLFGKNKKIGI